MSDRTHGRRSMIWLLYALGTVVTWGLYGLLLHTGQTAMADPVNGRFKAFLLVGGAYFLFAVVAPLLWLLVNGATWSFPLRGTAWSLAAGIAGAAGAFCVLLAFGAKGPPAVVMSIVFAGAPIVNALVALAVHPPAGGPASLRWQFVAGIVLAALGGCLVTLYRPGTTAGVAPPAAVRGPVEPGTAAR
jgi:drug/metabolite transporter (DMT)-like permease